MRTCLISFSLNVGILITTPFDCITLTFWRLIWPFLLCHNSMLVLVLRPFANMDDFTSFDSRINIRPSLQPRAMSQTSLSMKQPPWLNRTCIPWSTIWPTKTKFFVMVGTCNTFLMQVCSPTFSNGTLLICGMGELYHPRFRHNQVNLALEGLKIILDETSYGSRHRSRRTIHLPDWRH